MLYHPKNYCKGEGVYVLPERPYAVAHPVLDKPVWGEIFSGHAYHLSRLSVEHTDELIFRIGQVATPTLDGNAYAVRVEREGVAVVGRTERDLMHGVLLLLDAMVCETAGQVTIPCFSCAETPVVGCRMVHFCIFPDTELWELEKFVRFAGALRYTHLILEFWGMLHYDVMQALSWKHAFTKEQLSPILQEARDLGMEIVPMFNHWGHASACRVMHGKHVTLDQDPSQAYLFSPDGWRWAIEREPTRQLLKSIRRELCELCGEGAYFHIGCDEAYNFQFTEQNMQYMCDYFSSVADELAEEGRRAIIWGDMFLYRNPEYQKENRYDANAPSAQAEAYMLARLDKRLLIADWQYEINVYPAKTSLLLKEAGFDVLSCPWQNTRGIENCVKTVIDNRLFGVMHTTWHTLSASYPQVLRTALLAVQGDYGHTQKLHPYAAALLRKVYFAEGDYRRAGWSRYEIGVIT